MTPEPILLVSARPAIGCADKLVRLCITFDPDGLFSRDSHTRISPRRVQFAFRTWQMKAGFNLLYPFHSLRHSAVTNVYRASRDLFLAQRFARHASPLTTVVYTHSSDEELFKHLRSLSC